MCQTLCDVSDRIWRMSWQATSRRNSCASSWGSSAKEGWMSPTLARNFRLTDDRKGKRKHLGPYYLRPSSSAQSSQPVQKHQMPLPPAARFSRVQPQSYTIQRRFGSYPPGARHDSRLERTLGSSCLPITSSPCLPLQHFRSRGPVL